MNILKEALDLHPGESHFERALRLVQDKRDLVNSIVARAHLHEEQGAFGDALNDWEILRTIYSQYPGLKFEVERLQKRREQQSRIESKTQSDRADRRLSAFQRLRARLRLAGKRGSGISQRCRTGRTGKLAQEGIERETEAQRLMTEGQDLCAQQKSAEGIQVAARSLRTGRKQFSDARSSGQCAGGASPC